MITVENLLDAYLYAYDLWLDPELAMLENGHPRKNPTPEYAELIRKAVSAENAKLRELVADMWFWHYEGHIDSESQERQMEHIDGVLRRMRELRVEV